MARQAAAAVTLADRYTDAFAHAQRRKRPKAAAEIQQSLLPPRISRITGGEVAGNILPSYEVAGDWFDVVENADGVWITLADGLGGSTPAAASSAVALGALRAGRRSDADMAEALVVMHQTLREMPGPRAEMTAVVARWDSSTSKLRVANCGHVPPVVLRANGDVERLRFPKGRGLGGRASPRPVERTAALESGDRLLLVSDGVVRSGEGQAGLGTRGLIAAALRSERQTAADTVRQVHTAVLEASDGELRGRCDGGLPVDRLSPSGSDQARAGRTSRPKASMKGPCSWPTWWRFTSSNPSSAASSIQATCRAGSLETRTPARRSSGRTWRAASSKCSTISRSQHTGGPNRLVRHWSCAISRASSSVGAQETCSLEHHRLALAPALAKGVDHPSQPVGRPVDRREAVGPAADPRAPSPR